MIKLLDSLYVLKLFSMKKLVRSFTNSLLEAIVANLYNF